MIIDYVENVKYFLKTQGDNEWLTLQRLELITTLLKSLMLTKYVDKMINTALVLE